MEDDLYKLIPWPDLSSEIQNFIITNGAKNNEGHYIDPEDYERSSFYVDKDGNLAKNEDIDNWLKKSKNKRQKSVYEDPTYLERFQHRVNQVLQGIDQMWGSGNQAWGKPRIDAMNAALDRNPNFMDNWQSAQNVGEFVDVNLPGVSKVTSPSWWLGNIGQGYIENPLDYNIRNNGLFEFAPLKQYANEPWANYVNLGFDLGTTLGAGYGALRFNKYLNTPIYLNPGAETTEIFTYPFSNKVTKISTISPEVMEFRNSFRNLIVPSKYIGQTPEGLYKYEQARQTMSNNFNWKDLIENARKAGAYLINKNGENVFVKPTSNGEIYITDILGNTTKDGRLIDGGILSEADYNFLTMKKGGKLKLIPKAKSGIKIILPNGKTTDETYQIGSFIKLNGENFYRRVNNDGTLTKVWDGNNGTYDYTSPGVPSNIRNEIAKSLKIKGKDPNTLDNNIGKVFFNLYKYTPLGLAINAIPGLGEWTNQQIQNVIIRNTTGGIDFLDEGTQILSAPFKDYYYDGKYHDDFSYPLITKNWSNERNIVNLYTQQNDQGFNPSIIGAGRYANNEDYKGLPAYNGNFYGVDQIYLPISSKTYFDSNLDREYLQDHDVLTKGMESVEGLDDVQHYWMTPRKFGDQYYIDLEDVWDIDRAGLNSQNYPFILNQRLPVVFTDDEEKLNIIPELSNWFAVPDNWK